MNNRFETYFTRALHDAKINELIDTYSRRGYKAIETPHTRDDGFDLILFDPVSSKTIAFEIKTLPLDKKKSDSIELLRQRASDKGYEFRLVTIAKPKRYVIEIEWLDKALVNYFSEETIQEIEELASHVQYQSVEVFIDSIRISETSTVAEVHGSIDVELQYGSNSDLASDFGMVKPYTFDFEGELDLEIGGQSVNSADIRIDLSDWDGDGDLDDN